MGWKGIAGREQPVKRPADKSVHGWSIGGKGTGGEWERHGLSKLGPLLNCGFYSESHEESQRVFNKAACCAPDLDA